MNNSVPEKLQFSKVDQIGIIVHDIDKAIEHYESLGFGPFEPLQGITVIEREMYGKVVDDIAMNVRMAQVGSLQIELIQPVSGISLWKDFLETNGEGINHVAIWVDDIEKETAILVDKGFEVLYRSRFDNGGGAAYFDTREVGGILLELVQWKPK
jgi:catechol 2,3-dioxygenase-like lactoylglutathione lyase family enzyme